MKEYSTYLFDADGTLLDTTELIRRCFEYTCKRWAGIDVTSEQVIRNIGLPLRRQFEEILGPQAPERMEKMAASHLEYQLSIYRDHLALCADTGEVIPELSRLGKRLGIVTSRYPRTLTMYCKELGILQYFEVLITPADTERHKPHPDPILAALQRFGSSPAESVYIGDAEFDIESGSRADLDTVFVGWSHNDPAGFSTRPTYIINSMRELLA